MKLSLDMRTALSQTLTPQQIQYLKLLQLPVTQLEQQIRQEIEQNPMLEEAGIEDILDFEDKEPFDSGEVFSESATPVLEYDFDSGEEPDFETNDNSIDTHLKMKSNIDDQGDPFEFYNLLWQDESDIHINKKSAIPDDEDGEFYQIKDTTSALEEFGQQLRMLSLTEEEYIIGEQIIGDVDNDGYLRRDLNEMLDEINKLISELNHRTQVQEEEKRRKTDEAANVENPARLFAVSSEVVALLNKNSENLEAELSDSGSEEIPLLKTVTIEQLEKVLKLIQNLEPPGFASRSLQECLIAQCKYNVKPNAVQKLALEILENAYEAFSMKHYPVMLKQFEVDEDYLREAIDLIKRLNPKPGGIDAHSTMNSVIPDFLIYRDEESHELMIIVNDSRLPAIQLSSAYDKLKKEAKINVFNKETREWIKNKYEDAKFLIQAIRQRKNTMLKVMTAISGLQRDFFEVGPSGLKPLIYKNVAEETGLDISTVCRIVNGKYVQTEFGTFELKFFFSESLPSEDGEDVSTRVIKQILKDIIGTETKDKPYSDDKLAKELKNKGYNVARRTVAKYREQLRIPVARLRKEL
ncbi:MAG: RNA polymerase factor sigma-54 [Bacteroidota bacterium]